MDATRTRRHIQDHAEAVVRGDMAAVTADFAAALRPRVPELARALPQPVTAARVLDTEIGDARALATIRYTGTDGEVTIRSYWEEVGDRPVIVAVEPAGAGPGRDGERPPPRPGHGPPGRGWSPSGE